MDEAQALRERGRDRNEVLLLAKKSILGPVLDRPERVER